MVRPKKHRFLSSTIRDYYFRPRGIPSSSLQIADLHGDEIEAMRLCDREESAGRRMGVSRPTVQRLLYSGRKKVVDALIEGKAIHIRFPAYITFRPAAAHGGFTWRNRHRHGGR
jgi:predicted DNA-binding protein (UPF0251 family)